MADRPVLPDWPRLMRIELAAQYIGVSMSTFRNLAITPQNIGACVVYDRHSLDRFADHLAGQPMTPEEQTAQSADVERAFLEKRRRG